jgi:hypothetical protein
MAKMLGLSRSRFYELIVKGVFVPPVYSLATKKPFFPREIQETNLKVRAEQVGFNGEFVLFQERRSVPQEAPAGAPSRRRDGRAAGLVQSLKSLGLDSVDRAAVERALAACYPSGTDGHDDATVLRTIYRHLRRSGTA